MARARQLVLMLPGDNGSPQPLGRKKEVLERLRPFNIAQDGSQEGFSSAHGPGIRLEFPFVEEKDPVNQVMVSLLDEDFAWPVLMRLAKELGWALVDPESGRSFGG